MEVYMSNNKEMLLNVALIHKKEYSYQDIFAIDANKLLIYVSPEISVNIKENKPGYKMVHSLGTHYADIKLTRVKAYGYFKELAQDEKTVFYNIFNPSEYGQLLFYMLKFKNRLQKTKRVWCRELTPDAVEKAINDCKKDDEYDHLAKAYLSELIIDKYLEVLDKNNPVSLPEAYLHQKLQEEFEKWDGKEVDYYYLIRCNISGHMVSYFKPDNNEKIESIEEAKRLQDELTGKGFHLLQNSCAITEDKAPFLFSKKTLLKRLNVKSKEQQEKLYTILDNLYSQGFITNPNTDSEGIQESEIASIKDRLLALEEVSVYKNLVGYMAKRNKVRIRKNMIANNEINDDSGIMPTTIIPELGKLDGATARVYDVIVRRFLKSLSRDKITRKRRIKAVLGDHSKLNGDITEVISFGFKAIDCETTEELLDMMKLEDAAKTNPEIGNRIDSVEIKPSHSKGMPKITYQYLQKKMDRNERATKRNAQVKRYPIGYEQKQMEAISSLVTKSILIQESSEYVYNEKTGHFPSLYTDKSVIEEIYGILYDIKNGITGMNQGVSKCLNKLNDYHEYSKNKITEKEINYDVLKDANCPLCSTRLSITKTKILCTGCHFEIWKKIKGHLIEPKHLQQIIRLETTDQIIGFNFKNNQYGKAKLKYSAEKRRVVFVFD